MVINRMMILLLWWLRFWIEIWGKLKCWMLINYMQIQNEYRWNHQHILEDRRIAWLSFLGFVLVVDGVHRSSEKQSTGAFQEMR